MCPNKLPITEPVLESVRAIVPSDRRLTISSPEKETDCTAVMRVGVRIKGNLKGLKTSLKKYEMITGY